MGLRRVETGWDWVGTGIGRVGAGLVRGGGVPGFETGVLDWDGVGTAGVGTGWEVVGTGLVRPVLGRVGMWLGRGWGKLGRGLGRGWHGVETGCDGVGADCDADVVGLGRGTAHRVQVQRRAPPLDDAACRAYAKQFRYLCWHSGLQKFRLVKKEANSSKYHFQSSDPHAVLRKAVAMNFAASIEDLRYVSEPPLDFSCAWGPASGSAADRRGVDIQMGVDTGVDAGVDAGLAGEPLAPLPPPLPHESQSDATDAVQSQPAAPAPTTPPRRAAAARGAACAALEPVSPLPSPSLDLANLVVIVDGARSPLATPLSWELQPSPLLGGNHAQHVRQFQFISRVYAGRLPGDLDDMISRRQRPGPGDGAGGSGGWAGGIWRGAEARTRSTCASPSGA